MARRGLWLWRVAPRLVRRFPSSAGGWCSNRAWNGQVRARAAGRRERWSERAWSVRPSSRESQMFSWKDWRTASLNPWTSLIYVKDSEKKRTVGQWQEEQERERKGKKRKEKNKSQPLLLLCLLAVSNSLYLESVGIWSWYSCNLCLRESNDIISFSCCRCWCWKRPTKWKKQSAPGSPACESSRSWAWRSTGAAWRQTAGDLLVIGLDEEE